MDDLVTIRPRNMQSIDQIENVLQQIDSYAPGKESGVVLLQNPQFGGE